MAAANLWKMMPVSGIYPRSRLIYISTSPVFHSLLLQPCRKKHVLCIVANVSNASVLGKATKIAISSNSIRLDIIRLASTSIAATQNAVNTKPAIEDNFVISRPGIDSAPAGEVFLPESPIVHEIRTIDELTLPPIPSPPAVSEFVPDTLVDALTEPTLQSVGLGCAYTPIGWLQLLLEWLHVSVGLPWWGSIVLVTCCFRLCCFKLQVQSMKNQAIIQQYTQDMMDLQQKLTIARQAGDHLEVAMYSQKLVKFYKTKGINPLKSFLPMMAQTPLFLSMFWGLRAMANLPVESMRYGGTLWFTDLTIPDQYYLLPIITSATLFAIIKVGAETGKLSQQPHLSPLLVKGIYCMPAVMLFFIYRFDAAILCYWVTTNFFSLAQVSVLSIPQVKEYFGIPKAPTIPAKLHSKGLITTFQDTIANARIAREVATREDLNAEMFAAAGKKPIQRTFKYDPTKPPPVISTELVAKKKN